MGTMVAADRHPMQDTAELRLAPGERFLEIHAADLDMGGAPCPVRVLLTSRRVVLVPAGGDPVHACHELASPLPCTLAGLGCVEDGAEVTLLTEDGAARLQFPSRAKALAFALGVRAAAAQLGH